MDRIRVPARWREIAVIVAVCGLAVSACTSQPPDRGPGLAGEDDQAAAYDGLLPNLCDELLSPVAVATVLSAPARGQRSYVYQAPSGGRLRGMTCEHGIDRAGPILTVSAQEYADPETARSRYGAVTDRAALSSEAVRVLGRPGTLTSSSESSSLAVLDGRRTLEFGVRRGALPPERVRQALIDMATAVVERIAAGA